MATHFNIHGTITSDNYQEKKAESQKYGPLRLKLSQETIKFLNELKWTWSLDGGDLLAAVRDGGKMLPHDDDFDFWIYTEEITYETPHEQKVAFLEKMRKDLKSLIPEHLDVRIVKTYAYKLQIFDPSFGKYFWRAELDYHHVTNDLQLIVPLKPGQPDNQQFIVRMLHQHNEKFKMNCLRKYLIPVKPFGIEFQGIKYNCPAEPAKYLESNYGYIGKDAYFDKESGYYKQKQQ